MQWPQAARNSRWPIRAARVGETFDWLVDEGEDGGPVVGVNGGGKVGHVGGRLLSIGD